MSSDHELVKLIRKTYSTGFQVRLVLFLTYQPCHYSSGHSKARILADETSCTTRILNFAKKLRSFNVNVSIKVSYIYRAHWRLGDEPAMQKYRRAVAMAQLGLQLLHRAGIPVRAFGRKDWDFLVSRTCRPGVRREWAKGSSSKVFAVEVMENRKKLDHFVSLFLKRLQSLESAPASTMPCVTPTPPPSPAPYSPIDDAAAESVASGNYDCGNGGQTQEVLLNQLPQAPTPPSANFVLKALQLAPSPPSANFVLKALPHAGLSRQGQSVTQLPASLSIPLLRGMFMKPWPIPIN